MKVKSSELSPFALDFLMRLELLGALYAQLWAILNKLEREINNEI